MRILFTFENSLPSREADAEVFTTTARYLARVVDHASLHLPAPARSPSPGDGELETVPAFAPGRPAILRHVLCGLTIVGRRSFRRADLVYTRNLWVAGISLLFGQRVVFDHYRPWPEQIPPLVPLLRLIMRNRRFLLHICHSDYTRSAYRRIGIDPGKLVTIRNGFEPERLRAMPDRDAARALAGVPAGRKAVVYTGRINRRKGLDLLIAAATRLPDTVFLLVGATGSEPPELVAGLSSNVRLVPWQDEKDLATYLAAADILVIPPSTRPLRVFGSTVLPLKLFLYMAAGRPILAGRTPDVEEVLRHGENGFLAAPDDADALADALAVLLADAPLRARLARAAARESRTFSWEARAARILAAIAAAEGAAATHGRTGSVAPFPFRRLAAGCGHWGWHLLRTGSIVLPPTPLDRQGA